MINHNFGREKDYLSVNKQTTVTPLQMKKADTAAGFLSFYCITCER